MMKRAAEVMILLRAALHTEATTPVSLEAHIEILDSININRQSDISEMKLKLTAVKITGLILAGILAIAPVASAHFVRCWRIVRASREKAALDGMGAALNAGRWNPLAVKTVYCADSLALAGPLGSPRRLFPLVSNRYNDLFPIRIKAVITTSLRKYHVFVRKARRWAILFPQPERR
ncbi:MAG TPA: RES domain-containing protein [Chthoniobacterales bacterium]|nr:RES domain-containing protein [Chthoniobacterales bacterium]